jgi:hypothetical protein
MLRRRADTPPRVFSEKRLQTIENKGSECAKESKEKKEAASCGKDGLCLPHGKQATETPRRRTLGTGRLEGDTPGVLHGCESKGVAARAVCKIVKTKGEEKCVVRDGDSRSGTKGVAERAGSIVWAGILAGHRVR